jgi:hypothetical protein
VSIEVVATPSPVPAFSGSVQKTLHEMPTIRTRGRITFHT